MKKKKNDIISSKSRPSITGTLTLTTTTTDGRDIEKLLFIFFMFTIYVGISLLETRKMNCVFSSILEKFILLHLQEIEL